MYNLLTDPLIRYRQSGEAKREASLPEVYAALMADEVEAFPALRPHQRHAWHAVLVQLGAMAMHRDGLDTPPVDADEWRSIIRALTPDWPDDEPWQLVVEDITKPAFMQPPASSEERWQDFTTESDTPDELDPLDTAKNHDLKRSVAPAADANSWVFALITEQTTDAHMANNPAISRISGNGSRLAVSLTPSTRLGRHIRRDIVVLLSQWDSLGEDCGTTSNGRALLWLLPWDGKEVLSLSQLHPLYIEVCRRRRLAKDSNTGRLYARRASGTTKRIAGNEYLKGRTGDPWIPVDVKRNKILTLPPPFTTGFTYKRICDFITSGDWKLPLLCQSTREEAASSQTMYIVARGIAPGKGQNKTGGYYERIIPVRHKLKLAMLNPNEIQALGDIAQDRIKQVGKAQGILKDAVATFIARGKDLRRDLIPNERQRVRSDAAIWSNRLDEIVDATFFNGLQDEFEETEANHRLEIRHRWLRNDQDRSGVINHARALLHDAEDSIPCPSIYYYKAREAAEGLFEGRIQGGSGFPDLFPDRDEEAQE